MKLIFKNFDNKEILSTKIIDVGAHIPRFNEIVRISNARGLVVQVDYFLSNFENELYKKIEVSLQVFDSND